MVKVLRQATNEYPRPPHPHHSPLAPRILLDYCSWQGLYWVLKYYHVGVDAGGSWSWYYPHLYAPLASDMRGLMNVDISFEKGRWVCWSWRGDTAGGGGGEREEGW